jgi:hypothetical protein
MVSTRSRSITEPLALLTAGVVLSGTALVSAPKAGALYCDPAFTYYCFVAAAIAAPSYAITQGAILGSDVVAVAADAVAVVATLAPAAVATVVSGLPLSAAWEAPSVQTVVARFNADVAQLHTDWQDTFSAANFQVYVAGLTRGPAPSSAAASVLSRHSRSAKPAATPRAKAAAASARVAIVGGEPEQHVSAPTTDEQAAVVIHRGTRVSIHRGTVDSANKPQPRD